MRIDKMSNHDDFLQISLNLKKLFKYPDKIFSRLKLEFLLHNAQTAIKNRVQGRDLLVSYGNCLVQYLGKDEPLDPELLCHLMHILKKLQKEHEVVLDELVSRLCSKLENGAVLQTDPTFLLPEEIIEVLVLNWIGTTNSPYMALLAKMSAGSPKLFQIITSILGESLMRAQGHERILEVTNVFIQSVKSICLRENRDFLGLYPKTCCQVVSLLMVSPEIYSETEKSVAGEVMSLLFEMFLTDRQKTMILLSHYTRWVSDFKSFMFIST